MQALHRDENVQAMRAESGQKDDRFMALGIIYLSLHILEVTGKTQSLAYLRRKRDIEAPQLYRDLQLGAFEEEVRVARPRAEDNRLSQFFGAARPERSYHGVVGAHPGAFEEEGGEL